MHLLYWILLLIKENLLIHSRYQVNIQYISYTNEVNLNICQFLLNFRTLTCLHLSTRQYARIVNQWVESIGLGPHKYGSRLAYERNMGGIDTKAIREELPDLSSLHVT